MEKLRRLNEIEIDPETGMQLFKNELEHKLSFMNKLNLRIAKERGIDVSNLKGEEFKILKEYKKLEERKDKLNKMDDFFDPQYEMEAKDYHDGNIMVAGMNANESNQ